MNSLRNLLGTSPTPGSTSSRPDTTPSSRRKVDHVYPYSSESETDNEVDAEEDTAGQEHGQEQEQASTFRWTGLTSLSRDLKATRRINSLNDWASSSSSRIRRTVEPYLKDVEDRYKRVRMQVEIERRKYERRDEYRCGVALDSDPDSYLTHDHNSVVDDGEGNTDDLRSSVREAKGKERDYQNILIPECQNPQLNYRSPNCPDKSNSTICSKRCEVHLCEDCKRDFQSGVNSLLISRSRGNGEADTQEIQRGYDFVRERDGGREGWEWEW